MEKTGNQPVLHILAVRFVEILSCLLKPSLILLVVQAEMFTLPPVVLPPEKEETLACLS
jgi:hypothetical protein